MAVVLGVAGVLSGLRNEFSGNVKFIFQPAEEGMGGAKLMIEDGVLENPKVDAIIGEHVDPNLKTGYISVRSGPVMATPSEFEIVITGKGGHAAQPHKTINPIVIAADIVDKLNSILGSLPDKSKKAVLSVTYFHAGSSFNIIPDTAVIKGTVRTFEIDLSKDISRKIEEITASRVMGTGADYSFKYDIGYPPVVNDTAKVNALISSAKKVIPPENIITNAEPYMLAEDFAYYAQLVPGVFLHLGCKDPEDNVIRNLHSSTFCIDEACIQTGIEIISQFAIDYLGTKK
jgi:amidohydrolase